MRELCKAALDLIKSFEKCVLRVYDDGVGVMTVGWGHALKPGEHYPTGITQEQADALLVHDLANAQSAVDRYVRVPLTDNQYGALVSFAFNAGGGALMMSTLLRRLNAGDYAGAAAHFADWNKAHVHGVLTVMNGLTRRRAAEAALFGRADTAVT